MTRFILFPIAAFAFMSAQANPIHVSIDLAGQGHAVSPMLHGVFFEDINYAADGGLYAELVQNRSFEHREHLYSWGFVNRGGEGTLTVESTDSLNDRNIRYARLSISKPGEGVGLANYGFGGIVVDQAKDFFVSLYARSDSVFSSADGKLLVSIEDETGRPLARCEFTGLSQDWRYFETKVTASGPAEHARLVVLGSVAGRVDLDMVSLFPEDTWKHRRNGLRSDLVQMLVDLRPAFFRFPGGCIVEGMNLGNRYNWKDTIGNVAQRPENWNRWQDAIRSRSAPQYYQTYGLGFFEYFQLCEDIGAEPVPILNCGMACQYQSAELVPLDQLDPFVEDALDLIEFANGPVESKWGSKRAEMGHPEPFHLHYLGVGNEQWGESYFERYPVFRDAIKARYPEIKVVTTSGPGVDDDHWKLAWDKFRGGLPADIVDEHYYRPPQWFIENASRYDEQERNGPRVFAGEFAAHEGEPRRNSLRAAISEAAFMTGLVRNSDIVAMSSYAPLFAKKGAWQWSPDLIWFDNTRVYATPSYHVQAMFSRNRPDRTIPTKVDGSVVTLEQLPDGASSTYLVKENKPYRPSSLPPLFVVAGVDDEAGDLVVFVANPYDAAQDASFTCGENGVFIGSVVATMLTSESPDDVNSFAHPNKVAPRDTRLSKSENGFAGSFPPWSLTVVRARIR